MLKCRGTIVRSVRVCVTAPWGAGAAGSSTARAMRYPSGARIDETVRRRISAGEHYLVTQA